MHYFLRGGYTCQMRQAGYAKIFLNMRRDTDRVLAGAAAGAVSYADERRLKRRDLLRSGKNTVIPRVRLRRKNFE